MDTCLVSSISEHMNIADLQIILCLSGGCVEAECAADIADIGYSHVGCCFEK